MFDDNNQSQPVADPAVAPIADPAATPTTPMPATPVADPASAPALPVDPTPAAPAADPAASAFNVTPVSLDPVTSAPTVDATPSPAPEAQVVPTEPAVAMPSSAPAASGDLLSIKQDALQNLSPLLSQLDQSPEEKFRTTMMLIQASDDQSLIQAAYAAAKEINDEKVRAQALLDIINEINYFTQQAKPAA